MCCREGAALAEMRIAYLLFHHLTTISIIFLVLDSLNPIEIPSNFLESFCSQTNDRSNLKTNESEGYCNVATPRWPQHCAAELCHVRLQATRSRRSVECEHRQWRAEKCHPCCCNAAPFSERFQTELVVACWDRSMPGADNIV